MMQRILDTLRRDTRASLVALGADSISDASHKLCQVTIADVFSQITQENSGNCQRCCERAWVTRAGVRNEWT